MADKQDEISFDEVTGELRAFIVPTDIFDVEDLDIYEQSVYIILRSYCDSRGVNGFPSYNTIAEKGRMSRRKAIQAVEALVQKGLLKKETRDFSVVDEGKRVIKNKSNLYMVLNPKVVHEVHQSDEVVHAVHQLDDEVVHAVHQSDPQSGAHGAPYKDLVVVSKDSVVVVRELTNYFLDKLPPKERQHIPEIQEGIATMLAKDQAAADDIKRAIDYTARKKVKENVIGYVRSVLQNRYWDKAVKPSRDNETTQKKSVQKQNMKSNQRDDRYENFYKLFPEA